jgi:hypothetical protein
VTDFEATLQRLMVSVDTLSLSRSLRFIIGLHLVGRSDMLNGVVDTVFWTKIFQYVDH